MKNTRRGIIRRLTNPLVLLAAASAVFASRPDRPFTKKSYWNTPIPADAPVHPSSAAITAFLRADNKYPFVKFIGVAADGAWGRPIFWGRAGDPVYNVSCTNQCPPELAAVHIPRQGQSDSMTSDAAMTVYDRVQGAVFGFFVAKKVNDQWSVKSSSIHYLASNGLDGKWTQFTGTDSRNSGHRGAPASLIGYRWDEYQAGVIAHKLALSVHHTKDTHVFPYVGDENGTTDPSAPPEGALIRIKPSVKLATRGLSRAGLIAATALQKYGAVIADQSGCCMNVKVETTSIKTGGPQVWDGVLAWDALSRIPIEDYEVIQLGYGCGTSPLCSPVEQP